MLNSICQENIQRGKSYLPNPYPAHKLVIRKKSLKSIMAVKGWKSYSQMADALGFTRQYLAMIAGGIPISAEFVTRLAACMGDTKGNWHIHYEIAPRGRFHENHPVWNQQKHDGKIPYERLSLSGEFRNNEYYVEKKYKFDF